MSSKVLVRITFLNLALIALSAPLARASEDQLLLPTGLSLEPTLTSQPVTSPVLASAGTKNSDDWHMSANLGLWAMSLNGTIGVRRFDADVNESFSELVKDLDFGVMGGAE